VINKYIAVSEITLNIGHLEGSRVQITSIHSDNGMSGY